MLPYTYRSVIDYIQSKGYKSKTQTFKTNMFQNVTFTFYNLRPFINFALKDI